MRDKNQFELLPCPFCGTIDHEGSPWPSGSGHEEWVCNCGNPDCAVEVTAPTPEEVVSKWNRRILHDVPIGTFNCPICTQDTPHHHRLDGGRWIGVDFDGTLAQDDALNRSSPYELGKPIPKMVSRVKGWVAAGYRVKLLTARMNAYSYTADIYRDLVKMESVLQEWCKEHLGIVLECTCEKDGLMEVLWDDRAARVVIDTGDYKEPANLSTQIPTQIDAELTP